MTNLQKPTWYACYTEGLNSDVSFVRTYEEAVALIDWNISDDPSLSFDNLVTPLYLHPPQLQAVVVDLVKALNAFLTHMGMDEDEFNKPTFNQARAALAKAQGANR